MDLCYQPRTPLADPACFYGREKELAQLFSYLDKPKPQNISVVGQRRSGKSWLLKVLTLDDQRRTRFLHDADKYTFIYWDLQSEPCLEPASFFGRLTDLLLAQLPSDLAADCRGEYKEDCPEDSLQEMLEILRIYEHRVILLLDEFAAITRSKAFAESFFSHLRSVFSQPGLTCVTASYRSLGELCHLGPDSPFFNIFVRIQLGLFSDQEAEGFITGPMTAHGVQVAPDAVKEILSLTGPHPCFISQLCHDLESTAKTRGTLTKADVEAYQPDFLAAVFDDYSYYVQRLTDEERAMLVNLADGNPPATLENPTFLSLERLSLVRRHHGRAVLLSDTFKQFVRQVKGTDVYFEQAFANADLNGPNFIRLCEIILGAASHVPTSAKGNLAEAVRVMQGRPLEAMRICGRDVLDPLLDIVYRAETKSRWNGDQYEACVFFDARSQAGLFPKHLAAHFQSVRVSGAHGGHPYKFADACTPARAFLTVLETIHLAEDIYRRYPPTK